MHSAGQESGAHQVKQARAQARTARELYRLHQFRRIEFQIAGSLAQLSLPCGSAAEYAERIFA